MNSISNFSPTLQALPKNFLYIVGFDKTFTAAEVKSLNEIHIFLINGSRRKNLSLLSKPRFQNAVSVQPTPLGP